ncbi:MobA/MobL family protein [Puniceibacterium sediminis]|uniref:Plasmid mobilization system relaxase n=1 Tax=Puniceibacterium sediminis TaxID=1608407 RepID=A0A238VL17_9RHOB|nr:MobA/MobL family protein [Puniceibacterium sediminis]SNR35055.1 plasmid mobilization system relaxase [Puniceibacterium sediminis]
MIHAASHLTLSTYSRADGHSSVAAAAYRGRTSFVDLRTGRRHTYRSKTGLLSDEIIGWTGTAAELWNAAEAAETRSNARVARELRPALPADLPLGTQIRLVRGMALWLRDQYGVAVQANIHAPNFHDQDAGKIFWKNIGGKVDDRNLSRLWDPAATNLNFHAHLLFSTRRVDPQTGAFAGKTRELDDKTQGPAELLRIRSEWEKRTNAALEKVGSKSRIDMRSYNRMAEAGDAPGGLIAQKHLGPRRTARGRRLNRNLGKDHSVARQRREDVRDHNALAWETWMQLRALDRAQAREEDSAKIARAREDERKEAAAKARQKLQAARTREEAEAALASAHFIDAIHPESPMAAAAAAARDPETWARAMHQSGHQPDLAASMARDGLNPSLSSLPERPSLQTRSEEAPDEFSLELDLETYEPPVAPSASPPVLVVQHVRVLSRVR